MSKLRQLIEAANRKCEMAWKVYSYNPEKDNELVDTSKAFDCIAAAQAHKRDILEKNPNYTVEIIAESSQYKFKVGDRVLYEGDKATVVALRTTNASPYYDVEKDKEKGKQHHPAYEHELKPLQESAQKNEAANREQINDWAENNLAFNDTLEKTAKSIIVGFPQLSSKKKELIDNLKKYIADPDRSHPYTDAIEKTLGRKVESANIDVKNPGVLEVPDGKKVDELPQSHFEKLVDKKGYAEVIRALTNLEVWNKDKNKSLSSWASNMADKLKKKYRPESTQKFESKVNMSKLKNEIQTAVNKYFKDDKDLLEYVHIDTKKDKLGRDILEVRAELGYNNMVKLADYLDKIVTKYDKYAYFDQETSGIMTAVFESAQKDLASHLLQVLLKGGATLKQLQDFESKGYSNKDLLDTLKDLIQQKKIKTSLDGGTFRYTLTESAQKNESLRDLNLELADDTNAIAASADKIRQRFEYRTLQNQSYDEKQAEKIYLEVRRELEKAKKMIDACYNKIG